MDGARFGGSQRTPCYELAAFEEFASIFRIEAATNEKDQAAAFQVRYQIYCVENRFENPAQFPDGREKDHLDDRAVHGLVRHRGSGIACGTVRLILPPDDDGATPAGFYEFCDPPATLPMESTAEVSRFATSKVLRQRCEGFSDAKALLAVTPLLPYITVSLITFTIQEAIRHGITHLCAIMKPPLMRLLSRFGIYFEPIGPLVNYHGWRQPCFVPMDKLLADVRAEQPALWDIVTESGTLLEAPCRARVA